LSPAQLSRIWQMLLKALEEAGRAPDPIAAVEMALVRLCAAQTLPPPEDAARLLRDGPSRTAGVSPTGNTNGPGVGATSARERPAVQAPPPAPPAHPFQSFEDVTKAVAAERDIELEVTLDRMKVTHFSPNGDLVFVSTPEQPRDLARHLKAFLEERSEIEWRIRASEAVAAPVESLAERRKREDAKALEEVKRQPFVAEALRHFPGAEIAAVREPVDENAPAGDVVPMPQHKPAPAQPRKKEADR
jgi:DNA polymerase III subunit gamma/tau